MAGVRAVILDIDGTLIDSNAAHARSFVQAAEELGIPSPGVDEILRLIGMGGDKLIPKVFGFAHDSSDGEKLDERKGEIFRSRHLSNLRPTPGARPLLERLSGDGYTLVVATSASEDDLKGLLDRAGVRDLIEGATSADEVDESKPEPDVVQAALKQAGVAPHEAIMLGDTPYDVEASLRAGVPIIAVRSGGWRDEALQGALSVFDHPADILAHYDLTPLGG